MAAEVLRHQRSGDRRSNDRERKAVATAVGKIRAVATRLGDATLTTIEVYTGGDPTEKVDAMEAIVPSHLRHGAFRLSDELVALLKRAA
jgi:hypothetical protein